VSGAATAYFDEKMASLVERAEDVAAALLCRGVPGEEDLTIDEKRALAVERVVLGGAGRLLGKRRVLRFFGAERPEGMRGLFYLPIASRHVFLGGEGRYVVLFAVVVRRRDPEGELLLWRVCERSGSSPEGRGSRTYASCEAALMAYRA
jgi:hypothetical protein